MANIDIENPGADEAELEYALRTRTNYSAMPASTIMLPAHYIAAGTAAVIAGSSFFTPFHVLHTTTFTKLGLSTTVVGSAGAQCKLALYTDVGGYPAARVVDAGVLAVDAATGHLETTAFSAELQPAQYWALCMINNIAGATYERHGSNIPNIIFNTGALGASLTVPRAYVATITYASGPPTTAPAVTSSTANNPIITLRN